MRGGACAVIVLIACASPREHDDAGFDAGIDAGIDAGFELPPIEPGEYVDYTESLNWDLGLITVGTPPYSWQCTLSGTDIPCHFRLGRYLIVARIPPGAYSVGVVVTDASGQRGSTYPGENASIAVAEHPSPTIRITTPERDATVGTSTPFAFTIEPSDAGVADCYIDDTAVACDSVLTNLSPGDVTIVARLLQNGSTLDVDFVTVHVVP